MKVIIKVTLRSKSSLNMCNVVTWSYHSLVNSHNETAMPRAYIFWYVALSSKSLPKFVQIVIREISYTGKTCDVNHGVDDLY